MAFETSSNIFFLQYLVVDLFYRDAWGFWSKFCHGVDECFLIYGNQVVLVKPVI